MNAITWISNFLCTIGAINWGLVAFLRFNLVEYIAKYIPIPMLNLVVYGLVAVAGFYSLIVLFLSCKKQPKKKRRVPRKKMEKKQV
jgi:uncharacterized membrane protein YuzA (DUF378 family)